MWEILNLLRTKWNIDKFATLSPPLSPHTEWPGHMSAAAYQSAGRPSHNSLAGRELEIRLVRDPPATRSSKPLSKSPVLLQRRPCPMRISAATRSRGHSSTTRATKTIIKLPRDSKCQGRRTQRPRASLKNWRAPTAPTHRAADPNSLRLAFPLPRAHLRRLCSQANLKHRRAPWCSNTKLKRANLKHRRGPRRNNTKPKRWMAQCEPLRQPAGHDAA
jgi:hypothetical protein